jgi:F-type H+-transporting ATPase subunit b
MLDISLGMVVFVILLFLILIYLLNTMMYRPIIDFMDKRDASIESDESAISENSSAIEALEQEAELIISQAKESAYNMKSKELTKVKADLLSKFESQKSSLEQELSEFITELYSAKEGIKNNILEDLDSYKSSLESKLKAI